MSIIGDYHLKSPQAQILTDNVDVEWVHSAYRIVSPPSISPKIARR